MEEFFFFFFLMEKKILLNWETKKNQKLASFLITEAKQGGQPSQSKEPKKLQARDHLAWEWATILASLRTKKIDTLE